MFLARLALKSLRTRFVDRRPLILSHLLTARCNADCVTCLWKMPADSRTDELSTEEVEALYEDARAAGFLALVMWGGEPMVRADAGPLLGKAHSLGMNTSLITNGWWLADRGHEVFPVLDRLLLSVDGIGTLHDEIRKCPGLFERLDEGLKIARKDYPRTKVVILSVLSAANFDQMEAIADYGKQHDVQIIFQAMNFSDYGFADRSLDLQSVELSQEQERLIAERIQALQKGGYPVRDSHAYLKRLGSGAFSYSCHYKKVVLRVEPNGDVLDCTQTAEPLITTRSTALAEFVKSQQLVEFNVRAEACNRCRDAGVIELSHIWEGKPGALLNALKGLG